MQQKGMAETTFLHQARAMHLKTASTPGRPEAYRAALQQVQPIRDRSPDTLARFNIVVAPYLGDAYALARWLAGSGPDAEDIVQEASLRALHGINKFANGSARAWLLKIVRNTAYDWLRKNRSRSMVFVDDVEQVEGAHNDESDLQTPEAALLKNEEAALVEAAILALPLHFRETLVLREVQGMSYRDIAELTGISIGTTMSRLFRARRLVIEQLKNDGASGGRAGSE
jgi:RNA polymerase sigma factor (sigma-70 family)